MISEKLKQKILTSLESLNIYKIILFGSYAAGIAHEDSDIDLYVIIDNELVPKSFDDKVKLKLMVSKKLFEFRMQYSVDLIVHTKSMNKKFRALNSSFSKEIEERGVCLYEKTG